MQNYKEIMEISDDFEERGLSLPSCVRNHIKRQEDILKKRGIVVIKPKYATTSQYILLLEKGGKANVSC